MTATVQALVGQVRLTILWAVRDRVLHAVFGVGLLLLLLVPVFSDFSMRQVQEAAISLTLSASSLTLLVVAALLGSAAIFRDVDRRMADVELMVTSRNTRLAEEIDVVRVLVNQAHTFGNGGSFNNALNFTLSVPHKPALNCCVDSWRPHCNELANYTGH